MSCDLNINAPVPVRPQSLFENRDKQTPTMKTKELSKHVRDKVL